MSFRRGAHGLEIRAVRCNRDVDAFIAAAQIAEKQNPKWVAPSLPPPSTSYKN